MVRVNKGTAILCDGSYLDSGSDERLSCCEELHPSHNAIINKIGVLGHHCSFCHDPEKTDSVAKTLGLSQEELRDRYKSLPAAEKAAAEKLAKEKAKAAKPNGNGNGKPQPTVKPEPADPATSGEAGTDPDWPPAT